MIFSSERSQTVALSAYGVVPVVKDLLSPRSVLDIGCGTGEWLEAFDLEDSIGVDIAETQWRHGSGELRPVIRHDLTESLDLGRTFDLVVCLEVGEHLPYEAAETLVDSCVRHSNTVLFSAAVPGQAGEGHINCQPHEYWHAYFDLYEFEVLDVIRPRVAYNTRVSPWYRQNTFVYVHR